MKNSNQSSTEKYRILTKALLFLFHFPAILPVTFKKATRSNYPKRSSKPSKAKLESELKKKLHFWHCRSLLQPTAIKIAQLCRSSASALEVHPPQHNEHCAAVKFSLWIADPCRRVGAMSATDTDRDFLHFSIICRLFKKELIAIQKV